MRLKTVTTTPIVTHLSGEDLSKLLIMPGAGSVQGVDHGSIIGGSGAIFNMECYRQVTDVTWILKPEQLIDTYRVDNT